MFILSNEELVCRQTSESVNHMNELVFDYLYK